GAAHVSPAVAKGSLRKGRDLELAAVARVFRHPQAPEELAACPPELRELNRLGAAPDGDRGPRGLLPENCGGDYEPAGTGLQMEEAPKNPPQLGAAHVPFFTGCRHVFQLVRLAGDDNTEPLQPAPVGEPKGVVHYYHVRPLSAGVDVGAVATGMRA